jgi:MFS family permease
MDEVPMGGSLEQPAGSAAPGPGAPDDEARRRRLTGVLFGGVAFASTAYIAAATVSTLAIDEITGQATLAGVPGATAVIGTAVGTTLLTLGVARRGRRPGLVLGYGIAVVGAILCIVGVAASSVVGLIGGMALLGLGNASSHLSRYTAAGMYPRDRKGAALGTVVWAGTIGSVAGPALLQPSGRIAIDLGTSELAGGYLVSLVFMLAALALVAVGLRPDPMTLADEPPTPPRRGRAALTSALQAPPVKFALASMVAGQVVMVMIMTATPLHIHHHGSDLGVVGLVMSAHTLGMFALSPVTGRLTDRWGGRRVAPIGMVLLSLSALAAAYGPNESTPMLIVTLFTLGVGWNMSFVAGSAMLSGGVAGDIRARLQGAVDSLTWASGAVAAISSGFFYQATDYRALGLIGLGLLVPACVVMMRQRRQPATAAA